MGTTVLATVYPTGEVLAELGSLGTSYGSRLSGAGPCKGKVTLPELVDDTAIAKARSLVDALDPWRRGILVERDGKLVWSGMIVTVKPSGPRSLDFGAIEDWGYLARRRARWTATYASTDRFSMVRDTIARANAMSGGNVGITVGSEVGGDTVDRFTVYAWERRNIAAWVEEMSNADPGFDFAIDAGYESGELVKRFRIAARRGRPASQTGLTWVLGENILELDETKDGAKGGNHIDAIGDGQGATTSIGSATDVSKLVLPGSGGPGYPLMEDSVSAPQQTDKTQLNALAAGALPALSTPQRFYAVKVRASAVPKFGTYITGDGCYLEVPPFLDPRWPDGLKVTARIVGWDVAASDNDSANDVVTLMLGEEL